MRRTAIVKNLLAFGVMVGFLAATWVLAALSIGRPSSPKPQTPQYSAPPQLDRADPGLVYATAVRDDDCATALPMVAWMTDRLDWTAKQGLAVDGVRAELCGRITGVMGGPATVRNEGIDDAAVLVPSAQIEFVRVDGGLSDLGDLVSHRTWLRITYPDPHDAPRNRNGRPLKSLLAGVNIAQNGQVLKAAIIGNLELRPQAVWSEWPVAGTTSR